MRNLQCFLVFVLVIVFLGFSFNGALINASESWLFFDDPELSTFIAETYHLEGELPIGNTVEIAGKKAEIFRKFRITVPLDKPETYTPAEIVVKDDAGKELESYTHHIENRGEINLKLIQNDPKIDIDGEKFPLNVPMSLFSGSLFLPIKDIAEALRAKTEWDDENNVFTVTTKTKVVKLTVGLHIVDINGEEVNLGGKFYEIKMRNGAVMVPFRFTGEIFDAETRWDASDRSANFRVEFKAEVAFTKSKLNNPKHLILDDKEPSVLLKHEYMIEGEIPIGATVSVNGKDAEIFHKFRTEVGLREHPSYTPVDIKVFDSEGRITETRRIHIENIGELTMWLQQNNPSWKVIGVDDTLSVPPTIVGGSMMLPFRAIAEASGAEVEWIAATRTVRITLKEHTGTTTVELTINSRIATINGIEVELYMAPSIINGSTMVPLRFVGEAFGAEVIWNGDDRSVDIKKWIYPDPAEKDKEPPKEEFELTFDNPMFITYKAETYHLEGTISAGHTLNANHVEAEIFQKFKTFITLNDPPSYTPAVIEVTDKDGHELESYTLNIENYKEKIIKLVMMVDSMKVDGDSVDLSIPPMIIGGHYMIPIKDVAEALDGEFSWDEELQTATIFTKSKLTQLKVGDDFVTINEEKVYIDEPITTFHETVLVPFRLVESAFTDTIAKWDSVERLATIIRKYHPKPATNDSELNDEKNLILDDFSPSVSYERTYKLEGEIPMGATVKVNGLETEIFHKFRADILIEPHPSKNPVVIAAYNEAGNLVDSQEIVITNKTFTSRFGRITQR